MQYIKYQQGDVLLLKVSQAEFERHKLNVVTSMFETRALLAEGEATGHAHAVYMDEMLEEAGITLCKTHEYARTNGGLIVKGTVELKHEEHAPLTLPEGYYIQRIVKEHDHISGQTRGVAD